MAQHWPNIGKNVSENRYRCWNDNFGMHSGFFTSRLVCRGKSYTWPSNVPSMDRTLALLLPQLDAIVKVTIGLVHGETYYTNFYYSIFQSREKRITLRIFVSKNTKLYNNDMKL